MTRLHVGSLALRPAILPMGNLQPLVTQALLPGAKEVYGQLLLLDFNQQELQPFYGIRSGLTNGCFQINSLILMVP